MATPVLGHDDVIPGDVVEVSKDFRKPGKTGLATVVKSSVDALTVRWPDGSKTTRPYMRTEGIQSWRLGTKRLVVPNFERLDAHDRWFRIDKPKTPDLTGPGITVTREAVRDALPSVIAQLELISAWLKAEPPKGTP